MEKKTHKESGRRWDGKSRPSTEQYKKNYDEIFRTRGSTCVLCGCTPKNDQWSSQVENACFDCV
jgi:hypothetical protein